MTKVAMIKVARWMPEAWSLKMLLQVHDSLIFEGEHGLVGESILEYAEEIKRIMEDAIPLSVPILVNVGVGPNLACMKEI